MDTAQARSPDATEDPRLAMLAALLEGKGRGRYGLTCVTQLEHALQAAWLAEQEGGSASLITAALLHDTGHLVHDLGDNPAAEGTDDRHEERGHAWLARLFDAAVTEPVRLHVAAKRYLCAIDPAYFGTLSADSVQSLALQGGEMPAEEIEAFRALPHADDAVRLRIYDDRAKITGLATPDVAHFLPFAARCLLPEQKRSGGSYHLAQVLTCAGRYES